jgi:hypothetical protein
MFVHKQSGETRRFFKRAFSIFGFLKWEKEVFVSAAAAAAAAASTRPTQTT